jgi:hypothetical protein
MLFVWGRQVRRKRIGYVADFCPMCRGPQSFLMNSVSAYKHVYFVPVSDRDSGFERVCQGCKIRYAGTPKYYKASKARPRSVQDIVQSSFPSFNEVFADRLRIEDAVRNDPVKLPQNIRAALLRQPFNVVSPLVQARFRGQSRLDLHTAMALVFAIVGVVIASAIARTWWPDDEGVAVLVAGGIGILYFLWCLMTEPRRYLKRFIAPLLAKTLHPLQPTEAELAGVLAELKQSKQRLSALSAPKLIKAIATV